MRRYWLFSFGVVAAVGVFVAGSQNPSAQGQGLALGRPEISYPVHQDVSPALRDIPNRPAISTRDEFEPMRPPIGDRGGAQDTVLQQFAASPFPGVFGMSFPGVGAQNYAPPDSVGDVGPNHYVQWVNVRFAVFDKNGNPIMGPQAGNAVWAGFGGDCETRNDGDPIVQYDQLADRWILTQFAVRTRNYLQCVAVSTTPDPTGTYNRYAMPQPDFPDYPKLSVWPDAYYITFNMFKNGRSFSGGRVCAFERSAMLVGGAARQVCYQDTSMASMLPADLDGPTPPPAGTPNYVVYRNGSNALSLRTFHVDWANTANSSLSNASNISVANFSIACGGGACIPQKGTTNKLDSLGDRLMYRFAYRNLGAGGQHLVVNHSVTVGAVTGIRWYDLNANGSSVSVNQSGTYSVDSLYRWMGSIAMDKQGNIAVGYSTSNSSNYPAIEWAGRLASDPAGTLSAPHSLKSGSGSQTGTLQRWGDYSTISVDPVDDCTFWYTTEYLPSNGSFNWATEIQHFIFPGCSGPAPAPVTTTHAAKPHSH